ncbi:hypothetical protein LXL04_004934 [Taraxacum kok-saghyz]
MKPFNGYISHRPITAFVLHRCSTNARPRKGLPRNHRGGVHEDTTEPAQLHERFVKLRDPRTRFVFRCLNNLDILLVKPIFLQNAQMVK